MYKEAYLIGKSERSDFRYHHLIGSKFQSETIWAWSDRAQFAPTFSWGKLSHWQIWSCDILKMAKTKDANKNYAYFFKSSNT